MEPEANSSSPAVTGMEVEMKSLPESQSMDRKSNGNSLSTELESHGLFDHVDEKDCKRQLPMEETQKIQVLGLAEYFMKASITLCSWTLSRQGH